MADFTPPGTVNRRRLFATSFGVGALGGAWITGLSVLARGRRPQILVVGSGSWQLLVAEHEMHRIMILAGEFEFFPEASASHLLGVLRPRVDMVAGRQDDLDLIPAAYMRRLANPHRMVLDRATVQGDPNRTVAIGSGLDVALGPFRIRFSPVFQGEWSSAPSPRSWLVEMAIDDVVVAIGPSLDLLARHADARSTLAVAPSGHLAYLHRMVPNAAIMTNAASTHGLVVAAQDENGRACRVVRTFANDVAILEIRDGAIRVPPWTESLLLDTS
jgi:hypothetical protein